MKYKKDKKLGVIIAQPQTVLEAVEMLEEFLCADFGQKDWSIKFLKEHFSILKDHIRIILSTSHNNNFKTKLEEIYKACNDERVFEIQTRISKLLKEISS